MKTNAYTTAQNHQDDPRTREYRVFIAITAAMEHAIASERHTAVAELNHALFENQRLWSTLMADLSTEGNALPDELKAQLLSLGIWVHKHTTAVIAGEAKPQPLVDVNRIVLQGLQPQTVAQPMADASQAAYSEGKSVGAQA